MLMSGAKWAWDISANVWRVLIAPFCILSSFLNPTEHRCLGAVLAIDKKPSFMYSSGSCRLLRDSTHDGGGAVWEVMRSRVDMHYYTMQRKGLAALGKAGRGGALVRQDTKHRTLGERKSSPTSWIASSQESKLEGRDL